MDPSRLSGADCVEQLRQLGFIVKRLGGMTILEREGSRVAVPDVDVVDGAMLEAILRSAEIDMTTFLGLRKRSGLYARVSEPPPAETTGVSGARRARS